MLANALARTGLRAAVKRPAHVLWRLILVILSHTSLVLGDPFGELPSQPRILNAESPLQFEPQRLLPTLQPLLDIVVQLVVAMGQELAHQRLAFGAARE